MSRPVCLASLSSNPGPARLPYRRVLLHAGNGGALMSGMLFPNVTVSSESVVKARRAGTGRNIVLPD